MRMIYFREPPAEVLRRFRASQDTCDFTYTAIGATHTQAPAGFVVDRTRVKLGSGEDVFRVAQAALRRWDHFRLGWVEPWPESIPIQSGEVATIVIRQFGLWFLNACRIVYLVNEDGPIAKFGFCYGTLPGHLECGEERFQVEWHRADDSVWYDIVAFSKPNLLLARLGYPWVRRTQRRFARDSCAAMQRAVLSVAQVK